MNHDEEIEIIELMNIARVYVQHGDLERAEKVLELVEQMQERVRRNNNVTAMYDWRDTNQEKEA
ncbi:MAG TPA: hypothetical protein V6D22_07535 [Candidatus Obscuribacterales bacterium]